MKRILIANRGEIAVRIARTVKRLGLQPLIVFSDADRETQAVHDSAPGDRRNIGPARAAESYLNADAVLNAARDLGADAIHPGYGFLSENSDFARRVLAQGLIWIGPPPHAMDLVSSKSKAKELARTCNVPTVPGYQGEQALERFTVEAAKIGYPLLIKAAAGGGGRGIRRVENDWELRNQIPLAAAEAMNAFGSGELLLEKYVDDSRHIEVQIFGDAHGSVVHLGERDCSVQRRHQKLIEESPSPAVTADLREKITAAAVRLGRACGYQGAGTVEFLLSPAGEFYFLEVNARLQVEHPVTEMVTGLDLVEWQLRVARGEKLPLAQEQVRFTGHAVQLRLYAEDPYQQYRPQTGRIEAFAFAPAARTDHFLISRTEVSPYYDSMLAKIIVFAPTRAQALDAARAALAQTLISGLVTNQAFLKQILDSDFYIKGQAFTQTLDRWEFKPTAPAHAAVAMDLASLAEYLAHPAAPTEPLKSWSNGPFHACTVAWREGRALHLQRLTAGPAGKFTLEDAGRGETYEVLEWSPPRLRVQSRGREWQALVHRLAAGTEVQIEGEKHSFVSGLSPGKGPRTAGDTDSVAAPLAGTINRVNAVAGAAVNQGDVLAVIEAMKMQLELRSPRAGVIETVMIQAGQQVRHRQILMRLKPAPTKES